MKIRRFLALALAASMMIGGSLIALAEGEPATTSDIVDNGKGVFTTSVTTDTTFQAPIVKLVVPASTPVYLNPYGIKTTIAEVAGVNAAVTDSTAQIVSAIYKLNNYSNVPVKLVPTFTTTATGAVLLDGSKATEGLTTKWVKVSAELKTGSTTVTNDLGHKYTNKEGDLLPTLTIAAGSGITKSDAGVISGTPTEASIEFKGSVNSPANVATSWTETDKLKIVVKYDLYPQVQQ
jgi:hypothetical protein